MFYSEGKDMNNFDAITRFTDHEENFDGVGEYEVEVVNFPHFMNFVNLDLEDGMRQPMPPMFMPPMPQPNVPLGPNQNTSAPPGPPPSYIPSKSNQAQSLSGGPTSKFVSPGTLVPCLFRYVYIWQTNRRSYWAYLIFVDRRSIAGWRWSGHRWSWFGLDTRFIESFMCY